MKTIITLLIFVFAFGKAQAQTDWNIIPTPTDTTATYFGYSLNVIDSLTVILTPKYTYDSPNLIKTSDGGQTWDFHMIDSTLYTILHEAEFIDENNGYIVGGTDFGNWNVLLKTTDGGQNWENMDTSFLELYPTRITEVDFITPQLGFIAKHEENKIYRTTDGGNSFTALDLPAVSNGTYSYLTEIRFIDPYTGFVARSLTTDHETTVSEILKTTDGGNTWTVVNSADLQNVTVWEKKDKIQFVNNSQGFAIVGKGILKTTQDGGTTWTEFPLPVTTVPATDMYFVNNACGYLALDGNIYRTDDAGQTWNLQSIENNLDKVNYIQFATESFGYALDYEYAPQGQGQGIILLNTYQQPAEPLWSESFDFDSLLTIYPNPAEDFIHIQNDSNLTIQYIHLIDMHGKIIRTIESDFQSLNVSDISAGNYILFIQTSEQRIAKKVVVK
ncbi:MAG TPA: YCF48-related protein [Flavobacterium sp.]|nr:YCF48-related protein [Flavobacterium sp.]